MAVNYGQVAIVPKGEWNVETQYKVNNLVSYDGSSYVAKVQPPVGTLPTDTSYWQVSAAGTKKATADSLGTVMPDGTTTSVGEDGKLSVNTAQQDALGVVKGSDDITVGEDGTLTVNTTFEQATELANIIAGEAIKSVLGKVSKAIATTMSLDENALLKNMISGIDVNDGNKVPSSAYIHSLVERIGMGTALEGGFDNLTDGLNSVNNNLSKYNFNLGDTTANNHKNIDRIATFSGGTWINKNYNADFGGQWCFVDSFLIDDNGPYAIQRIMSAQTNTVLATRYCEKNVWGDWNIGVTKSDLVTRTAIALTAANSYSFNADYTYGYKRAGWVEFQFNLESAFDRSKNNVLHIPDDCVADKQIWFPVFSSSGGNVIARGMVYHTDVHIIGIDAINGAKGLFGHVVYMSKS
jgi:hypothetical protein